jgi:uncharacterized OB-fold protein
MTGRVVTFTVIHVAPAEWEPTPYGVVVVDGPDGRVVARAVDPTWLAVGADAEVEGGWARPAALTTDNMLQS